MCLDCGCGKAHDDHGEKGHILYEDLAKAASVNGVSVNEVVKSINKTAVSDRTKHTDEYDAVVLGYNH